MPSTSPDEILEFWFAPGSQANWFRRSAEFDREIAERFGPTSVAASAGELDDWSNTPQGALALVIALDQFPRNMHRGSPQAFAYDTKALAVSERAIERGDDWRTPLPRQMFFYLPFQHSEDLAVQQRGVTLTQQWVEAHEDRERPRAEMVLGFAKQHRDIVERFGRFPHRNAVLGRASTPEEEAFLREPSSSF